MRGYSFIELLVVIALLVTVIGTGIPLYAAYIEKAKITKATEEISALQKEIQIMVLHQVQNLRIYLMIGHVRYVELEKNHLRRSDIAESC